MTTLRSKSLLKYNPSSSLTVLTTSVGQFPFIFCADCKKPIENTDAIAGWNEDGAVGFAHNDCEDNFELAEDLITFFANLMHNTGVTVAALRTERKTNPLLVSANRLVQAAQPEVAR
jgi:hypothetical protein